MYILDPHLQAGQKLPRWQPRSKRGVFMGFSHLHSSEVRLVLNLDTGSITPQYHVVFDDHFSTVSSVERENDPPDNWAELCLENATYIPNETVKSTNETSQVMPNTLDLEWLTPNEQEWAHRAMARKEVIRDTMIPSTTTAPTSTPKVPPKVPTLPTPNVLRHAQAETGATGATKPPNLSLSQPPTWTMPPSSTTTTPPVAEQSSEPPPPLIPRTTALFLMNLVLDDHREQQRESFRRLVILMKHFCHQQCMLPSALTDMLCNLPTWQNYLPVLTLAW